MGAAASEAFLVPCVEEALSDGEADTAGAAARCLARLAAAWRPDIYVDVHSGETYLATPFSSKLAGPHNATHRGGHRASAPRRHGSG